MELFYLMATNELCSVSRQAIRKNASGNNQAVLCFKLKYHKLYIKFQYYFKVEYFSYNGEKYSDHRNSLYDHKYSSLGDIENKILAVGGSLGNEVEQFDINSNTWTTKVSFPFCP